MKRLVSTAIAIALLLGLGALAVLARGGGDILSPADTVVAAAAQPQIASAPDAPAVRYGWSAIALPLRVSSVTTADGVASYIDSAGSIKQVARWDVVSQSWVIRTVGSPGKPLDFAVTTGTPLLVATDKLVDATFGWVGDVPAQGTIHNPLTASAWNYIMLPLDQGAITTADALATAINGGVTKVARWDGGSQSWVIRTVGSPGKPFDFAVSIGYPYMILTGTTSPTQWP